MLLGYDEPTQEQIKAELAAYADFMVDETMDESYKDGAERVRQDFLNTLQRDDHNTLTDEDLELLF